MQMEMYDSDSDGAYCQITERERLEQFLEENERVELATEPQEFEIDEDEFNQIMESNGDESSFNDDFIPPSELDFMSSDFDESDPEYVQPLTRTKKAVIVQLIQNQLREDDNDEMSEEKRTLRKEAIVNFRDYLIKKRAIKAYKRLRKVKQMRLGDPVQEALYLQRLELADKKLNRGYYYESCEPKCMKKLLNKRIAAIRDKYRKYGTDECYRRRYNAQIYKSVANAIKAACREDADNYEEEGGVITEEEEGDSECEEPQPKAENGATSKDEPGAESDESSFYDERIPDSELEYFSSAYEEEETLFPGPKSRKLDKYRRLMNQYKPLDTDTWEQVAEKKIKKADVTAQFMNYCDKRRAVKALARIETIESMSFSSPEDEAEELMNLEIADKKLNNEYYMDPSEPRHLIKLLNKRRQAIYAKYVEYARDPKFREYLKQDAYVKILRIQPSPLFDKKSPLEELGDYDDESSFNDSEVPTSEEEFMSGLSFDIPFNYEKPLTRQKQDLYCELDRYEVDFLNDTASMIENKRKARFGAIQRYKQRIADRRKMKAVARLEYVRRMGTQNYAAMAQELEKMELADKKLNGMYYYAADEPSQFTTLLNKRRRAIRRKLQQYALDKNFRENYETRVFEAIKHPKNENEYEAPELDDEEMSFETMDDEDGLFDDGYHRGSLIEPDCKLERRRNFATAGIWPKCRESAPAAMEAASDSFRRLSLDYGGHTLRDYQNCLLEN